MTGTISRAKKFVQDHKVSIAVVTGVGIGIGATVIAVKLHADVMPGTIYRCEIKPESLEYLRENLTGVIAFEVGNAPKDRIWLVNAANPENKLSFNELLNK